MGKTNEFAQKLSDAGVPISGIEGSGPTAVIQFLSQATPQQRTAANALRATFDWVEKPDPTVPGVLALIAGMTASRRQTLYSAAVAELVVRFGLKVDLSQG